MRTAQSNLNNHVAEGNTLNSLLSRQLRKAFNIESEERLTEWLASLNTDNDGTTDLSLAALKQGLALLIPRINESYDFHERDLKLRDRSLRLSSDELMSANHKIREENKQHQRVIETLRHSVNQLLVEQGKPPIDDDFTNLHELSSLILELINEQKRLEHKLKEEQAFHQSITDSIGEGIYAVDGNGKARFLNPTASKLLGWTLEELQQHRFHDTVHYQKEDGTLLARDNCPVNLTTKKGEIYRSYEDVFTNKQGKMFPISIIAVPLLDKDGNPSGHVGVFNDISEQRANARKLQQAYEEAQKANKAKSEFLATVSHEIRTPMNAIIGLTHLALNTQDAATKHAYLEKVQGSSSSLLELINGILDFSKVEANKIDIVNESFSLSKLIEKLGPIFQVKAREKHLQLLFDIRCSPSTQCKGDSDKIYQVLVNLIGNAIKFTETGYVMLKVVRERRFVTFEVHDSGMGISEENKVKLFNAFEQADNTISRRYGGTGLGLTIGKRLVELMGGELTLESTVDSGSIFAFTLDLCEEDIPKDITNNAPLPVSISENVLCLTAGCEVELGVSVLHDALMRMGVTCSTIDMESEQLPQFAAQAMAFLPDNDRLWKRFLNLLRFGDFDHLNLRTIISPLSKLDVKKRMGKQYKESFNILELPFTDSELIPCISPSNESRATTNEQGLESKYWRRKRLGGKRALVVDDDLISLEISQQILIDHDMEVTTVTNGEQALELCQHVHFDVVLLDCFLPGIDGFEVAERLSQADHWFTPIIALSADESSQGRQRALIAGMCEHLVKPATPDEIVHAIDMHIHAGYKEVSATHCDDPKLDRMLQFYNTYRQPTIMTRLLDLMTKEDVNSTLLDDLLDDAIEIGATTLALSLKNILKGPPIKHLTFAERVSVMSMQLDTTFRLIAHSINMKHTTHVEGTYDKTSVNGLIDSIVELLKAYDAEAINQINQLANDMQDTEFSHNVSGIRQSVGIYDFDSALDAMLQLREDINHE
jgi:PAS domain S-box-containing protein